MIVKLVNPRSRQVMVFQCASEVYFEPQEPMSEREQDKWMENAEGLDYEPRRFAIWPEGFDEDTKIEMTEIVLPLAPGKRGPGVEPQMILTNWDAWLCNEQGKSIDKIHRCTVA